MERDKRGIPIIPPLPKDQPPPGDPNPVVSVCGECGIDIYSIMHYYCSNPRCPCGLGGIYSSLHFS